MKSFVAAIFVAAAAALPAPQDASTPSTTSSAPSSGVSAPSSAAPANLVFTGLALRSASPIHFSSLNANGGSFWLGTGKNTTTSCPSSLGSVCDGVTTNRTLFSYTPGKTTLNLDTIVPGGQAVYVTAGDESQGICGGALKFTPAHSVRTDGPPVYEGFTTAGESSPLQFEGKDWLACPEDEAATEYGIFAASRVANPREECLGFTWLTATITGGVTGAWQYE
jgi:hypothetical protein